MRYFFKLFLVHYVHYSVFESPIIECKNEVHIDRREINKFETGQMNNACAWFERELGNVPVKNIIVISTKYISSAAGFNKRVEVMRPAKLSLLVRNVRRFYLEFKNFDLNDLSEKKIQELLDTYSLNTTDFLSDLYSEQPRQR
ncbi:MAG: hypothetical protein PHH19_02195 [Eubacteriales bacterium]|nr:hypothetical protein [Eubacteriales bacterium]